MKELRPTFEPGERTLIYNELKGKIFSQIRVYQTGRSTSIVLVFEDGTNFHVAVEPEPLVRLSLYGEHKNGDLKEIAETGKIRLPINE